MSQRNRDEDKRRRRKKRLEKRARSTRSGAGEPLDKLHQVLTQLQHQLAVPEPGQWPGGCDPSLARPDQVKLALAQFATEQSPGREKLERFEDGCRKGLLQVLPEIDHWSWEEFIYHGVPGDSWHPIDAYLAQAGDRYPPAAAAQLRRWKEAQPGLYEIGTVAEDTLTLREWDGVQHQATGPALRAITLNIGGVNVFRGQQGQILFTYLAPWLPEANLFCGMGYSRAVARENSDDLLLHLGWRFPQVVSKPLPWEENRAAAERYLREWRNREWYSWLAERLVFPFRALVSLPPKGMPGLREVRGLIPTTAEQARLFGIYFEVPPGIGTDPMVAGGTAVMPLEVTSPERLALAEYHAFRERVGPPPGARGMPSFMELPGRESR